MDANVSLEKGDKLNVTPNEVSNSRIHSYLINEFEKKNDLKKSLEKIDNLKKTQTKNRDDFDQIYKFKLEKTKGDAMFSHINSIPRSDGTILGTKLNTYTNHVNRYNLSKGLVSEAQLLERSWVRNFSNFLLSKIYRYRYNYLFKGTVVVGIYSTFMSLSHYGNSSKNEIEFADAISKSWLPYRMFLFGGVAFSLILV